MSSTFITENFLLQTPQAVRLYHEHARDLPILDYHCHLPPRQIAEDHRFANLTQIWLYGDHYKWRAMRAAGVEERYCTGDAPDWEKFQQWAAVVPRTLRNPLYHWTHLELKRPFGISDRLLGPETAQGIWDECNALLVQDDFSCRGIMRQMNVVLVCTTDDPTDTLEYHRAVAAEQEPLAYPHAEREEYKWFPIRVLPTFRPDRALAVQSPEAFNEWVERLAEVSRVEIGDHFARFLEALHQRHDFFHAAGCRLSDHGLEAFPDAGYTLVELLAIFRRVRAGEQPTAEESAKFSAAMLDKFALWNHEKGWTQQFHLGAMRNNNTRKFHELGPDTGFDSISDCSLARPLARFLDRLECSKRLAKTILYNLNPVHNEVLATMLGNFQDRCMPGKLQWGSAWWFLDQKDGMERQLNVLSNMGLLSCFVGMLTDSRSFLSYTRHEYFRRILCNLLGSEMRDGLLPSDFGLVGSLVQDVCYHNAKRYFGFDVAP